MLLTLLDRRLAASFLAVAHLLLIVAATPGSTTAAERVLFYHNDALGSPVAMTDAAGSVVWRADYEPFGGIAAESGTVGNTHQFTGKERDPETGLQYFGARFYDGGIGRFLSVDPALLRGRPLSALQSPQQLNVYAYSANNTYRFIDPDGRFPVLAFAVGVVVFMTLTRPSPVNAPAIGQDPRTLYDRESDSEYLGHTFKFAVGAAVTPGSGGVRAADTAGETLQSLSRIPWRSWAESEKVIIAGREYAKVGERLYARHAVERTLPSNLGRAAGMTGEEGGRSFPPAFVEDVIQRGSQTRAVKDGVERTIHTLGDAQVVTEQGGRIVISVNPYSGK